MSIVARALLALAGVALLGAGACSTRPAHSPATTRRPNIVFVLVDDLRWDEVRAAGHPFAETPNMDRLVREGARFLNAFATTPLCSPSRASFLTGQYAHTNGIRDNTARPSHELATSRMKLPMLPSTAAAHSTANTGWRSGAKAPAELDGLMAGALSVMRAIL